MRHIKWCVDGLVHVGPYNTRHPRAWVRGNFSGSFQRKVGLLQFGVVGMNGDWMIISQIPIPPRMPIFSQSFYRSGNLVT